MRCAALVVVAVVAVTAIGCRSPSVRDRSTTTEGEPAPAPARRESIPAAGDAAMDADTSADASAGAAPSTPAQSALPRTPTARPLPPARHLLAPFGRTKARGFVAITNIDRAVPERERRAILALPAATTDALDVDRPVLVASFTKLFTAVAALRLIEQKALSLDDTIATTLPELASRPWASSTVRELLSHTSLVPDFDEKSGFYRRVDVDFSSPAAVLAQHVPRSWAEKRGVYKYRNAELAIVGAILAERGKAPAGDLLAREVFEPSGMKHAGLLVGRAPPGLDLTPMGPIRPQNFFTAGAGYASPADLLAFFEALAGSALLTPASKALLVDGAPARGHGALGCWAYPFASPDGGTTPLVERPGSFGNVRLFSAFFPDEGRAIVAWNGDGVDIARPRAGKGIGLSLARAALE